MYYTDDELIERIKDPVRFGTTADDVASLVQERFDQRLHAQGLLMQRVEVAANLIGHHTITDMMAEEGY